MPHLTWAVDGLGMATVIRLWDDGRYEEVFCLFKGVSGYIGKYLVENN